jgi:hypothetical protein
MLSDLGADLVESLPDDAYPGEDTAAVVIQMVIGTIRTVLEAAGERTSSGPRSSLPTLAIVSLST